MVEMEMGEDDDVHDFGSHADTRFLVTSLFGDAEGATMAARIDRRIDRLPGLDGLGLMAGAIERWAA